MPQHGGACTKVDRLHLHQDCLEVLHNGTKKVQSTTKRAADEATEVVKAVLIN